MDPNRRPADVTMRLTGSNFGGDRSRIATAAQLRNALAKLRIRRGLLNHELNSLITEMGPPQISTDISTTIVGSSLSVNTDVNVGENAAQVSSQNASSTGPSVSKTDQNNQQTTAVPAVKPVVYSNLQQAYLRQTSPDDLEELIKQRNAVQEKLLNFQKNAGKRLPAPKEPPRLRTNWDCLLDEMKWMASDFDQEFVWKRTCALNVAYKAQKHVERRTLRRKTVEFAEIASRRNVARTLSAAVSNFWKQISLLNKLKEDSIPVECFVTRADKYSSPVTNDLVIDSSAIHKTLRNSFIDDRVICYGDYPEVSKLQNVDKRSFFNQVIAARKSQPQGLLKASCPSAKYSSSCGTSLRDYQVVALDWLYSVSDLNAVLADDPGLGKHVVSVTFLANRPLTAGRRHLIIASPASIDRWLNEFNTRFPSFTTVVYSSSNAEHKSTRADLETACVCLTTFQTASTDVFIRSGLWDYIIVDVADQLFPDFSDSHWVPILSLDASHRLLLATVHNQENSKMTSLLLESSLLRFIAAGLFESLEDFKCWADQQNGVSTPGRQHIFKNVHSFLSVFVLRRTDAEVAAQLPSSKDEILFCEQSQRQSKLCSRLLPTDANSLDLRYVLHLVMKLHQICAHPDIVDPLPERDSVYLDVFPYIPKMFSNIIEYKPFSYVSKKFITAIADMQIAPSRQSIGSPVKMNVVSTRTLPSTSPLYENALRSCFVSLNLARMPYTPEEFHSNTVIDVKPVPCFVALSISEMFEGAASLSSIYPRFISPVISRPFFGDGIALKHDIGQATFPAPVSSCFHRYSTTAKLQLLGVSLKNLLQHGRRVIIIAQTSETIDVVESFLRQHRHSYARDKLPNELCKVKAKSVPSVTLCSTRSPSMHTSMFLKNFDSAILFQHDWNPVIQSQVECLLSAASKASSFSIIRLICKDTVDEFIANNRHSPIFEATDPLNILLGSQSRPLSACPPEHEVSAAMTHVETAVDNHLGQLLLKRLQAFPEQKMFALLSQPDMERSWLLGSGLRPFELWALQNIARDPKWGSSTCYDFSAKRPLTAVDQLANEPTRVDDESMAVISNGPMCLSQVPANSRLALTRLPKQRKHTANNKESSLFPCGVVIASGHLRSLETEPVLYYLKSRTGCFEAQVRRFADEHKLFLESSVIAPPSIPERDELFIPSSTGEDDLNDFSQWGLFASVDSLSRMFRVRTPQSRKKKTKKARRRGIRLANVITDENSTSIKVRISYSNVAGFKRKALEQTPTSTAAKKPRTTNEPVSVAAQAAQAAGLVAAFQIKPITMAHPVPFSDEEDVLVVCAVMLFGSNFVIAANFLDSDLIVCGRLRTAKQCAERYAHLVRRGKEVGEKLWEKLEASSEPVPPIPGCDPQTGYRQALDWLRHRSQVRNKAASEALFETVSNAVRGITQHNLLCKKALRSPLASLPVEAFKESLVRAHASHSLALTAGHKRLMIPPSNVGSTLSPRQIVELRALRDRTLESKKMASIQTPQQLMSPGLRPGQMIPTSMVPAARSVSAPMASSPVLMSNSGSTAEPPSMSTTPTMAIVSQNVDSADLEIDANNQFLLRQLMQNHPAMKPRLLAILRRSDLTQAQKMETVLALFQASDDNMQVDGSLSTS